jgi:Domain of unknown function (DUF4209)
MDLLESDYANGGEKSELPFDLFLSSNVSSLVACGESQHGYDDDDIDNFESQWHLLAQNNSIAAAWPSDDDEKELNVHWWRSLGRQFGQASFKCLRVASRCRSLAFSVARARSGDGCRLCALYLLASLSESKVSSETSACIRQAFCALVCARIEYIVGCHWLRGENRDDDERALDCGDDDEDRGLGVPKLAVDLFSHRTTIRVLGVHRVFWLLVLMGPPIGLNLRNLLWHGFLHCRQVTDDIAALLLLVFDSLDNALRRRQDEPSASSSSSSSMLSMRRRRVSLAGCADELHRFVPPFEPLSSDEAAALCRRSHFVVSRRESAVLAAYALHNGDDEYDGTTLDAEARALATLAVLLPTLEHCLRIRYVLANELPRAMMCAESDAYYTTLDMFLAPTLPDSAETPNRLADELGARMMDALADMFLWRCGPALRDRVAHDDVDMATLDRRVIDRLFSLFFALCRRYNVPPPSEPCAFCASYVPPVFHPATRCLVVASHARDALSKLDADFAQWRHDAEQCSDGDYVECWRERVLDADTLAPMALVQDALARLAEHLLDATPFGAELTHFGSESVARLQQLRHVRALAIVVRQWAEALRERVSTLHSAALSGTATGGQLRAFDRCVPLHGAMIDSVRMWLGFVHALVAERIAQPSAKRTRALLSLVQNQHKRVASHQWAPTLAVQHVRPIVTQIFNDTIKS